MTGKLAGRIALVTGASRGIGRAAALRFAQEGATVVAVARTQAALEDLDDAIAAIGGHCVLVPVDLRDGDKVDQVGFALGERYGRLDILLANAGVLGTLAPLGHIKPKDWDDVIATNLTVNWRLVRILDPLLRRSEAGRAIFVTSRVGREPRAYWGGYAVAKAGLDMMARIYADEVEKTALRVNLYDPGATRTHLRASAYPGEDPEALPAPDSHGDALVWLASAECHSHGSLIVAGQGEAEAE